MINNSSSLEEKKIKSQINSLLLKQEFMSALSVLDSNPGFSIHYENSYFTFKAVHHDNVKWLQECVKRHALTGENNHFISNNHIYSLAMNYQSHKCANFLLESNLVLSPVCIDKFKKGIALTDNQEFMVTLSNLVSPYVKISTYNTALTFSALAKVIGHCATYFQHQHLNQLSNALKLACDITAQRNLLKPNELGNTDYKKVKRLMEHYKVFHIELEKNFLESYILKKTYPLSNELNTGYLNKI